MVEDSKWPVTTETKSVVMVVHQIAKSNLAGTVQVAMPLRGTHALELLNQT
jgi:hypothetical protein